MENIRKPLEFVDSLDESRKHIALFYDDPEYARFVEFRFLKNGLVKGEHCVYATEEDSGSIVLKMLHYGIPLEYFETKKLLVYQIHSYHDSHEELTNRCKRDAEMMLFALPPPFRIAGRIVPDISTAAGMLLELEFERKTHTCFDDLGGSVMCRYDLSKIEKTRRKEWLAELRENHHDVIYVPLSEKGGVFSCC